MSKKEFKFKFGTTEIVIIIAVIVVSFMLSKVLVGMNGYYYLELPSDRDKNMIAIKEFNDKKILISWFRDERVSYSFLDENGTVLSNGEIGQIYFNNTLSYKKVDDNLSFLFGRVKVDKKENFTEIYDQNWSKSK